MREKKVPNSYLNQRSAMPDSNDNSTTTGVYTETLAPATVKISSDLSTFANPYSILTNEYVETKTKAVAVSYVIDPAELAKNEVKLPKITETASSAATNAATSPAIEKVKEKEYPLPEIPVTPAAPKMSDMEILNRLSQYQDAPVQKPEMNFDVPKDAEIFKTAKEESNSNDLEILNELQADEAETKKSSPTKEQMNTAMNGLEGLLAELSGDDDSNTLGMG